jgi:DNA-binding NtrC family response regulator
VSDHHGYIEVACTEGQGTCFQIYLTLADSDKRREVPPESPPVAHGKGQSILVVDDDEEQRLIASEILVHLGYEVQIAESGEAALLLFQDNIFDLVILDIIMPPGIDGLETYKRICDFHPGQKAIIVSGFSQSDRAKEALTMGALQYVQMPYALAKISEAVHAALTP